LLKPIAQRQGIWDRQVDGLFYLKLCGNIRRRSQKIVLETSFPKFNPDKFPLFIANLPYSVDDSTNFTEKVIF
jgi:hypothetical protein